jgi:hypothetical protein
MSEVKVNKISPRTNCGTVTLGDSGDTFTIPAGATITNNGTAAGFGATGAASWDTTVKTTGFTAVSGVGYFVNTTGGAISVNLPAGTAGDVVAIKDYANTFDTNAVTLVQNGSDKIGGSAVNATLSTEGLAVTLVFVDSTQGWLVTDNGTQDTAPTAQYVTATGGTITTCGNFKIHTFTGPDTFCVSCGGNATGSNTVDYLVIAGGGGSGSERGGGGGAGGYRESSGAASGCYSASPLGACVSALPVSITGYPITVGAGGSSTPYPPYGRGLQGANSIFSTITSAGGGGGSGARLNPANMPLSNGGSGGGGAHNDLDPPGRFGGTGNSPPVSPPQGNNGGNAGPPAPQGGAAGGGGGSGGGGQPGTTDGSPGIGGKGGIGVATSITGSAVTRAGGGAGGAWGGPSEPNNPGGGPGGGGVGGGPGNESTAGTANTGGGGGGGGPGYQGETGGSGIVVIRYKFQN